MTALLDESRLAYAGRKVRRLRDDVAAWRGDRGVLEDLVRDANRLAQDLLALDRLALGPAVPAGPEDPARPVMADIAAWAADAGRLVEAADGVGTVEGLDELRGHLDAAREIAAADPTERVFRELAPAWKADTRYVSSTTAMTAHWAYQRIIRLGPPVVPLLLRELRHAPDFWFAALRAITGENPVPPEDRGKVAAAADAWVRWGEARRLV